jgi:hypothetical protein
MNKRLRDFDVCVWRLLHAPLEQGLQLYFCQIRELSLSMVRTLLSRSLQSWAASAHSALFLSLSVQGSFCARFRLAGKDRLS